MQSLFQKVVKFMGSRLARNIYFWVAIFTIKHSDIDDLYAYSNAFYYTIMIFLLLFFVGLTCFNNFFLVPRLLAKKKWLLYLLSASAFTFSVAFIYTVVLKLLPVYFPGIDTRDLSIVTNAVSPDLCFECILYDMETFFFFMVVLVIIFTLLWYSNESVRKTAELQKIINKHRETELAFLKNQINPHFLFNTLNNLYSLALKKSDEAPETILKLSSIMRYMLYESNVDQVSFDKEKEVMAAYIDIELLRLPGAPSIQFSMMADKPYSIPPLLWLPVLENIFKHGRNLEELEIDFRFNIHNNKLNVYSKNNTRANVNPSKTEGGIGLKNLSKRLELLFPQKHSIRITTDGNYFIIEFEVILD